MALSTAEPEIKTTRVSAESAPAMTADFESWGRYPKLKAHLVPMHWQQDFPANIAGLHNGALPVGMGRSYGDSCLLKDGNLVVDDGDEPAAGASMRRRAC